MDEALGKNINKKELQRFLVVGLSAVGTDALVYFILINFLSTEVAKMLSFVSGSFLAFLLNKIWTFENSASVKPQIIKFAILYISTLVINNYTNSLVLELFNNTLFAFLVATGVSTVLNFLGQKFWVFK
ncbi:MAG: GtrA family protein [Bdellovibrionota bacterium]|nr:GtrA family protein [Bdellovibrionota bacterium]